MIGEHTNRIRSAEVTKEILTGELKVSELGCDSASTVIFEDIVAFGNWSILRGVKTHSSLVHGNRGALGMIPSSALYSHYILDGSNRSSVISK